MELTGKGLAALVIPAIITLAGTQIDTAMKWRAELQQREYDRQMKILDKIINTENPEQRIAVAKFYLNAGTFTGMYQTELEASILLAEEERKQLLMVTAEYSAELKEQEELESLNSELPPSEEFNAGMGTGAAPAPMPLPAPMEPPPIVTEIPIRKLEIPSIGPKTIFSYDKQALQ